MSHPAVLARELGLTAVIGVPDLLARVADGDLVEVDPVAGDDPSDRRRRLAPRASVGCAGRGAP